LLDDEGNPIENSSNNETPDSPENDSGNQSEEPNSDQE
jgi:hypothetical protein